MEGVAGGEQGEEDSGGKHTPAWGALRPHRPPLQLTRPPLEAAVCRVSPESSQN